MAKIAEVQEVSRGLLKPYERNAKIHSEEQVKKIADSIKEFGFVNPVLIDRDYNIIAGHGRVMAAESLGLDTVPCLYVEGLTDEQRRAYILADNRLGELAEWNMDIVNAELLELDGEGFDISLTGFDLELGNWFIDRERNDTSRQDGNDEYNEFLDKFEQPKTTDDCYTPDIVYDAVAQWVAAEYKLNKKDFVRPFYPGGDYQNEEYKKGSVVVDNPPFSIITEIITYYCDKGVRFFLFAPSLTLFGSGRQCDVCYMATGAEVTYENGAIVRTSFITNLDTAKVKSTPELYKTVQTAADEYRKELKRELPKYSYPDEVITSTMIQYLSKYGEQFTVMPTECERIASLDAQKEQGKAIFGSGFLISEKAAAEKAAAEKAAAEKAAAEKAAAEKAAAEIWELSDREKEIVKTLSNQA